MTPEQAKDMAKAYDDAFVLREAQKLIAQFLSVGSSEVLIDWENERIRDPLKNFLSTLSLWHQKKHVHDETDFIRAQYCNNIIGDPSHPQGGTFKRPEPGHPEIKGGKWKGKATT